MTMNHHQLEKPHPLHYTIHSCSSCSSTFHPFNIIEDCPLDSSSRCYPGQLPKKKEYIIIDLGKPCIVRSITFGKFHRPHPCNVKLFRVWGSLAPGPRMELLAQGELKNDAVPETVQLRWRNNQSTGIIIPVRYLKLEPLSAAGSNYNCSIWHVAVSGHDEEDLIIPALQQYEKWRTSAALRLCLKHLRQTGHLEAFEALLKSSALPNHSPTLLRDHPSSLQKAEEIVRNATLGGLFDHWARGEPPSLTCYQIHPSTQAPDQWPCPRGGHQMCLDSKRRKIWLFGGFDGYGDLADLWMKMRGGNGEEAKTGWELISSDVEEQNGPMSRSCHKMILDELTGDLYVLGRYTERMRVKPATDTSISSKANNDGQIGQWECISRDTESHGGPKLIFDHQMVLDSDTGKIYVFGGKVIRPNYRPPLPGDSTTDSSLQAKPSSPPAQYSGLYEYDLNTKIWTQLLNDTNSPVKSNEANVIPSRMGHALVLDKKRQSLWILTGERDEDYYSDLWRYHIPTRQSELITADYSSRIGPEAGFSQRTTFDEQRDEWHMFGGLCRDRNSSGTGSGIKKGELMSSEFWRWRIEDGKWTRVVMMADDEGANAPPPRYAHQMVFDELTNHHYVFGGNPEGVSELRLGDFWRLKLVQATPDEALRRCLFGIRRQQFIEMCLTTDAVTALTYLQVDLSAVTNHSDELEAKMFRACTSYLLTSNERSSEDYDMEFQADEQEDEILLSSRRKLFEGLLKYFPKSMTEPEESLMDLVDVWGDRETFW
ncbi:uncharacterized protein MELLADRAFT_48111 [Melampsora larici-populina 98AG31]|uniref:Muskelin N-terminal domain-containing protein n=1 Tax=Melampsora larici-populina (strain 98AG31 / pathotype 3-4-7) TaxID=747676 RepID=F4RJR9_MELLP|nr:uncharacterized protein MELLADRAFT_48111 [Melampsora larici-populina 98AG31]EGG07447.1 hypothetical protein MELLADRAFT_48111 [Melampsora larici-populina 98AG31]